MPNASLVESVDQGATHAAMSGAFAAAGLVEPGQSVERLHVAIMMAALIKTISIIESPAAKARAFEAAILALSASVAS